MKKDMKVMVFAAAWSTFCCFVSIALIVDAMKFKNTSNVDLDFISKLEGMNLRRMGPNERRQFLDAFVGYMMKVDREAGMAEIAHERLHAIWDRMNEEYHDEIIDYLTH